MNKSYMVDNNGTVTVVTDSGTLKVREDKYTKNTAEILSLENYKELKEAKKRILEHRISNLINNKKTTKTTMIFLPTTLFFFIAILLLSSTPLTYIKIMFLIFSIATTLIETALLIELKKTDKKIKQVNPLLVNEKETIKKINKKINILKEDKKKIKKEPGPIFTDVKKIYEFKFDASDHFIEQYQIDKRTNEMNHSKQKNKRLVKNSYISYK